MSILAGVGFEVLKNEGQENALCTVESLCEILFMHKNPLKPVGFFPFHRCLAESN